MTLADAERCAQLEAQLFPATTRGRWRPSRGNWPPRTVTMWLPASLLLAPTRFAGFQPRLRSPPRHPRRVRRHRTVGPQAALRVRSAHHRRRPRLPGPRHRPPAAERVVALRRRGTVYLEVRTDNAAAIALYRSAGFVNVGLRRRYYRVSGADAYTMRRDPQ
ncbi:putative ribosomal-protein-alanine acetyltransferase, RimI [Mycobacterium xenopi 4042]|uniref:Putative ribosomal-protein-alanine acetyltransferase, RimI n=1 Tax=Mycobacterium xenopi 4042 TaxID=1299334 RepID=X7YKR6_MYCXE|nr:putative ribosomal-protein-alanine acetyltransferase, RimI [Mycobacterium xenopi 4042]